MRFTAGDKHLWLKNSYGLKRLLKQLNYFRRNILRVKIIDQKVSERSLTLAILRSYVVDHNMDTYESVMPLLSLSLINVFNPTELYSLPGNIAGKRYASYVYIGEQLVIIFIYLQRQIALP